MVLVGALAVMATAGTVLALGTMPPAPQTPPPSADQLLRKAAQATLAARSFVMTETFSATPSPNGADSPTRGETATVVYRAPDQVLETSSVDGRSQSVLALGPKRYERVGSGDWVALGSRAPTEPTGSQVVAGVLAPLELVTRASDVVRHGATYSFELAPGQLPTLLGEVLGSQGDEFPSATASFATTVRGRFLHDIDVTVAVPGDRIVLHLGLGSIDHAPILEAPPA